MLAFIQGNNTQRRAHDAEDPVEEIRAQALRLVPGGDPVHRWPSCAAGARSRSAPDANLLEDDDLERALRNTHGFANVILEPQIEFTAGQVRRLKDFYSDFFDRRRANEAKALGKETGEAFAGLVDRALKTWLAQQRTLSLPGCAE